MLATAAKAFSVLPSLLCKQGVAGSSPATSTNHHHFNQMPSEFSRVTTCYSGRGREFECPHVHQLNSRSHMDSRCFFLGTSLPQSRDNRYNRSKNKCQHDARVDAEGHLGYPDRPARFAHTLSHESSPWVSNWLAGHAVPSEVRILAKAKGGLADPRAPRKARPLLLPIQPAGTAVTARSAALFVRGSEARSKRSRFITLFHAATKSFTNFSLESAQA